MHIGVFDVLNKVLFQKLTGDVSKNTIFLQVFKVFCICFQNPYFLVLAFPFVGFEFLCFFCFVFLVVVIGQIRLLCSGFCFCCFGFPWFFMWYVFFFLCFWFVLFFFFMEGLRVK